jgi:HEAT repeat protein
VFSRAGWEPGTTYVHRLDYRVTIGSEQKDATEAAERFSFRVTGLAKTRVSEHRGDEVRVSMQLGEVKLDAGAKANVPEAIKSALAAPFFVDYDERGRALRLHVRPGMDRTILGVLREIVSISQFSVTDPPASNWTAIESDTTGEYRATYRETIGARILRQKTEYVRVAGRKNKAPDAPTIPVYGAEFELDDWGRISSLKCTSAVASSWAGGGQSITSNTELSLKVISRTRDTQGLPLSVEGLEATSFSPSEKELAEAGIATDKKIVDGATVDQLLGELCATDDANARSAAEVRLAALFRLDPRAVTTALGKLDARNAAAILAALGNARTPEAEKALADVLKDPKREPLDRVAAVDAVLAMEHPTAETVEALEVAVASNDPELKSNASLALGVVSARMAENEPEAAQAVVEKMSNDYKAATTNDERRRTLGSLGNTRSADALPAIVEALKSSDPSVRATAAAALRFVPDPEADRLLSGVLTSDPDPEVRTAALMAAGYRAYEPLAKALETVAKDPNSTLRLRLVSALAEMAQQDNDAFVLLDWIAQNDADKDVRASAEKALASRA